MAMFTKKEAEKPQQHPPQEGVAEKPKQEAPFGFEDDASKGELQTNTAGSSVMAYDFGEDAGKGMENVGADELKLTWVDVIQSNSPQIDETSPKYLPGAKVGMFFTTTGLLFKSGELGFVPAFREHNYVEFIPRDLGSGFQGMYAPNDQFILNLIAETNRKRNKPAKTKVFGKLSTATQWSSDGKPLDGTEFTETFYLFGYFFPVNAPDEAFAGGIRFKSTQIKKYQDFVTNYLGFKYKTPKGTQTPPIWAHRWRFHTGPESTKKGKFQGQNIRLFEQHEDGREKDKSFSLMAMDDPMYQAAKKLNQQMTGGVVKADFAAQPEQTREPGEDDDVEM